MMKGGNMCTLLNFSTQYSGEKKKQIVNSDILETVRYLSEEDGGWGGTLFLLDLFPELQIFYLCPK